MGIHQQSNTKTQNSITEPAGLIEKEWAAILAREQAKRAVAEYAVGAVWEPEESSRLVEDAAAFVQGYQR